VEDCGSITGTLISMRGEEHFTTKKSLLLQYNQILMEMRVEEGLLGCLSPESNCKVSYRKNR
jgi:hypothetical protein